MMCSDVLSGLHFKFTALVLSLALSCALDTADPAYTAPEFRV